MDNLSGKVKYTPHVIRGVDEFKKKIGDRVANCLTGIRPSGRLHLGHYKGALENWLHLQENPNIKNNFLIADYQVLGDYLGETERLRNAVVDMVIDWHSIGLDPQKSNFVVQSYVPEFSELFNLITMFTPYSVARNNPTLKDEIKKLEDRGGDNNGISLGFVNYPVNQVADIMLLKGEVIPVGEDQIPHIELSRNIIRKINNMYGTKFPLPMAMISDTPRVVGIDGNDKMSKSLGNTIYLTATLEEIKKGVNAMYTDQGKISIKSPGNIDNHVVFKYLDIFYNDKEHIKELKTRYIKGGENSVGDGELKKLLIKVLDELISPIREKRKFYQNNMPLIVSSIEAGSENVRKIGQEVLRELKENMGIIGYGREFTN